MNGSKYSSWDCIRDNNPKLHRDLNRIERMFWPMGRNPYSKLRLECAEDYRNALINCSPLSAILLKCADAFSNGLFEVLNRRTQNYTRGAYKEWDELLANPNPFQSKQEFLQLLYIYKRMAGYCYGLPVYPAGFTDRPTSIFLLPPWCVEVELKNQTKPMYQYRRGESMRRVFFTLNGWRTELKEEDLILFTDNSLDLDPLTLLPESILKTLHYPISMFVSSEEAGITTVQKRGPLGIFSNNPGKDSVGTIPMEEEERLIVQEELNRFGLTREQWQYLVTSQSLNWIPIEVNLAELRLDENQLKAVKAMSFSLGFPFELTPFTEQATYNNKKEAKVELYQDTIIPQATRTVDQLNTGLKTAKANIEIKVTYEDVAALQQTQKEKGDGLRSLNQALKISWDNGIITRNMWLKKIGEDTVSNPIFDKYKFELTPEELGIVNQNVNNENQNTGGSANTQTGSGQSA